LGCLAQSSSILNCIGNPGNEVNISLTDTTINATNFKIFESNCNPLYYSLLAIDTAILEINADIDCINSNQFKSIKVDTSFTNMINYLDINMSNQIDIITVTVNEGIIRNDYGIINTSCSPPVKIKTTVQQINGNGIPIYSETYIQIQ